MSLYGKELVLDLHECHQRAFNRNNIYTFFVQLCERIDMERCEFHFWDDLNTPFEERETEPHLVGTSAIQFIKTSNITIHTLDLLHKVFLNVFSCKDFNCDEVERCAVEFFEGKVAKRTLITRV